MNVGQKAFPEKGRVRNAAKKNQRWGVTSNDMEQKKTVIVEIP